MKWFLMDVAMTKVKWQEEEPSTDQILKAKQIFLAWMSESFLDGFWASFRQGIFR